MARKSKKGLIEIVSDNVNTIIHNWEDAIVGGAKTTADVTSEAVKANTKIANASN